MRFAMSSSPHIRCSDNTRRIMLDVLIALLPTLLAGTIFFGLRCLLLAAVSIAAAGLAEALWNKLTRRYQTVEDLSAAVTGLLLALTALSPLLKLDYDAIAKQIAEIRLDTETVRTGVEVQNRELQARIISEQAAAYIWDKADEMGVALEVEVETRDLGSGPYPWRATLTGTCGGEKRTALTQYIEENLAIPEARQVWQCE